MHRSGHDRAIVQTDLAIPPGYFPIINAATTDFRRPCAMHLPRNEGASGKPMQMQARLLQFLRRRHAQGEAALGGVARRAPVASPQSWGESASGAVPGGGATAV